MEKSIDLCYAIREACDIKEQDLRTVSPLTLAYIGDSIYDLVIRTMIVCKGNKQVNKMHKQVSELVKAHGQVRMYESIVDILTKEEEAVYKRGRNAKSYTAAKNATKIDYRKATGYEALLGYLYLDGKMDRILELVVAGVNKLEDNHE